MKSFHDTVWKITAALILIKPGIDEKLVFALTRAPLKLFNAATMKVKYSLTDPKEIWYAQKDSHSAWTIKIPRSCFH